MNKIIKKEYPSLFKYILDFEIDESYRQHRRGSNFFVKKVVEFIPENAELFPEIQDFAPLVGTWETNDFITDTEYGNDLSDIDTLTRVYQKEKVITTKTWEPCGVAGPYLDTKTETVHKYIITVTKVIENDRE